MWFAPVPGVDMLRFGARLRGSFTPAASGVHQLSLVSAGLARLLLDGRPLSDNWEGRKPGEHYFGFGSADVLTGAHNPSGRLPQTFPARLEDHPAIFNYPGENGRVRYGEGSFVGYRAYERRRLAPLFPFGYGLSYTCFAYGEPRLSAATVGPDEALTVSVEVTNTGERAGQEVVQLYVRPEQASPTPYRK
jgi:hypothetical protein